MLQAVYTLQHFIGNNIREIEICQPEFRPPGYICELVAAEILGIQILIM